MKEAVLVLNGSFNPPTTAHLALLAMARNTIENQGYTVIKGLFVPTHGGYPKPGLADADQRVTMCHLTASTSLNIQELLPDGQTWSSGWVEVEPHDTQQEKWCRVVDTLAYIQTRFPNARLFFVCGSDLVLRWNEPVWPPEQVREIVTKYGVVVAGRKEAVSEVIARVPVLKGLESGIFPINGNPMDLVSSTLVRDDLAGGKEISGLVVPEVEQYIREKNLYS
jgi:nicotinate (nicotinamide) nucleotide adenylyltransferase